MASTIILSDNGASSGSAGIKTTGGNDGVLILQTTTSGGTATNAVYVDTSQNIGMGTSAPVGRLHTYTATGSNIFRMETASTTSGETCRFSFKNASGTADVRSGVIEWYDNATFKGDYRFLKAGGVAWRNSSDVETIRFDNSGNVGIGTSSPVSQMHIYKASGTALFTAQVSTAYCYFANDATYGFIGSNYGGTGIKLKVDLQAPDNAFTLNSSGYLIVPGIYNLTTGAGANVHVAADGTMYRSTSSLKYKTDVQDATHGLAEVMALRPVTYKGNNDGELVFGGLIAEEVHEAGLTEFVQYAEDGTPDALAYANMVSLAFKAIQELKVINDTQAQAITTLTERITALEAK